MAKSRSHGDRSKRIAYKRSGRSNKGTKGWNGRNNDGKLLEKLMLEGTITVAMSPAVIKERFPTFRKYKNDAFGAAVRRMRMKHGLNNRKNQGENSGESFSRSHTVLVPSRSLFAN